MTQSRSGVLPQRREREPFLGLFPAFLRQYRGDPAWLRQRRENAMARFAAAGLPTSRDEGWRQTPVSRLAGLGSSSPATIAVADQMESLALPGTWRQVLVNGLLDPALGSQEAPPAGVTITGLRQALAAGPQRLESLLGRDDLPGGTPLALLNDAFLEDAILVEIAAGKTVAAPLHLLSYSTGGGAAVHPRLLIHAGPGSQLHVIEHHAGVGNYLTNPLTDLILEQGAVLAHERLVEESGQGVHTGLLRVRQERDSNLAALALSLSGYLVRGDVHVVLDGEGADCTLNGLYLAAGQEHTDQHTIIDHARPRCTSRELYKGIMDGEGRGVFTGRIIVRPGAQKTSAWQTNKNLLMSAGALASSTPQLEIHADDVQCRHGSTVGQLDEAMLFYLRSRGIAAAAAREVLTYAFASEVLGQVRLEPLRLRLESRLFARAEVPAPAFLP